MSMISWFCWRRYCVSISKSDTTIPLIDIVSIYKLFVNRQGGLEGVLDEASENRYQ